MLMYDFIDNSFNLPNNNFISDIFDILIDTGVRSATMIHGFRFNNENSSDGKIKSEEMYKSRKAKDQNYQLLNILNKYPMMNSNNRE
jgi:hypothetical protein